MNSALTQRLFNDCPLIYRNKADGSKTIVGSREFECGDGWFTIIHEMSLGIESIARKMHSEGKPLNELPHVIQIKEKFAGLRVYMAQSSVGGDELIDAARHEAEKTCEQCGSPGSKQESDTGYFMVTCDVCLRANGG